MIQDVNVKALKKNAFRYSKVRGETASRGARARRPREREEHGQDRGDSGRVW